MKTAVILLNYKDAEGTGAAMDRLSSMKRVDFVVVVDNASGDGSFERLAAHGEELNRARLQDGPVYCVLSAGKNGGYGSGNNLGVRYARQTLDAGICIIANPDARFSETLVREMLACFERDDALGAVGAVMTGETDTSEKAAGRTEDRPMKREKKQTRMKTPGRAETGQERPAGTESCSPTLTELRCSAWPRRSLAGCLLASGPVSRRLFRPFIEYGAAHFKGGAAEVYAVHGSLLAVNADRFLSAGGYDEEVFLYCEENILAARLKQAGYKSVLLLYPGYRHEGGSSTGRVLGASDRQRLRARSETIYYERYLHAGPAKLAAARVFQAVVLAETLLSEKLGVLK